jgi:hypothetical protein
VSFYVKGGSEAMDERTIQSSLTELIEEIEKLPERPAKKSKKAAAKAIAVPKSIGSSGKSVDEMVDYLRLQIKYMVFDLEATRRENNYLRKMLDTRGPHAEGGQGF